ncbi:tRNA modification GTPase TrmE [Yamadazyma tenuis ATCC 10573]|uniref:tRNA modification GTPase TrmE n=1 Tax=Candida tenuis (strain ATCC 10573 / BCRC 21748 / CBS 615 / JCM 9827 / NBRC 10315 / NRRL Y-1498 / VKM Y-70) TaxID=590646 RepID=G3BC78_CANTC|nr:tRNA modification GTPase TrmE [Yamadazyma tenuis ATCC 10573]EGV60137.1 tRNA modification GTPase TrmE [Yamadazyma tenuis ATCC 10573]
MDYTPTIYALSTPLSRSAIGVIRVSGSQSEYVFQQLTKTTTTPQHRISSLRQIRSPRTGIILDEALTLFFKGPNSYTGENSLELHVHGGVAIIQSVLKEIKHLHNPGAGINIRYADPGEFSQRAFMNGRADLTELEGIREMIDAETESQRVSALSSMTGKNKQLFMEWRLKVLNNIALLTTVIDFGEDHDIDEVGQLVEDVNSNIQELRLQIFEFLKKTERSQILLKGIQMTLLGPPNAGKSSLLNALANKDAAIVSSIAGTTRDAIDIPLDISGYKVVAGDTAGVRDIDLADEIEAEGIRRAKSRSLGSDIALVVLPMGKEFGNTGDDFFSHIEELKASNAQIVGVLNKEDLASGSEKMEFVSQFAELLPKSPIFPVSCKTGEGINNLLDHLTGTFQEITSSGNSDPVSISERVKDLLVKDVLYGFDEFERWKDADDVVLASECLRQSVEGIGKITGEAIGVEEILGVVFSSFCIGK